MTPNERARSEDFPWATLAARLLHPIQVQVIEAVHWIGRPLTMCEMQKVFDGKPSRLALDRQVQRLVNLGALEVAEIGEVRGVESRAYDLVRGSGSRQRP